MTLLLLFSCLLLLFYIGLLLYYRIGWVQIPVFQPTNINHLPSIFITVIIPARNEEKNLPVLLDSLLAQSYPPELFEIMVMDDHSTDETTAIVKKYTNCTLIHLKDFIPPGEINSYKKKAIEIGIQQSKGQLIVTTDADCLVPPNWLQTMAAFYEIHQPKLIVMPVIMNGSSRPLEIFQILDFMTLQGITGASVFKKMHSMCNGANLAYTRQAFNAVNGFKGIDSIASGDDMLLMHKIAMKYPDGIFFLKSQEVIVQTEPMFTIRDFFNQRIRWASKADKYDDKRIFWVLLLVYLFNVMLIILPLIAVGAALLYNIDERTWNIAGTWLILLFLKTITELGFLYPVALFFKNKHLLWYFPLAQPFHIFYTVIAGWLGKFGTYQWKERIVK
jgi:cellulose synthase/poly-beta-1,6-N-acetylglucosamine synthase-like glycosyltransferase